ncbi:MAG TPA: DUF4389 domain-containing protein [Amycolatopsis sp.]|uniref:DUF4389 domain-containing protein n=1 Tax=Amycolatopsis sp. TaxID=37632 RepID=UPI002B4989A4|nr:DUF4389 domain-containing protein [Amycolatopsis sp.]HKS43635.1 DUF4389 domain-containing protein [Amycolatopsis sp.]
MKEVKAVVYPVRVEASLDTGLSRWSWLVKWILLIPHYVVLFFLWIAFCLLTGVALFAILFTGRYPRAMFDFNVGVLRWTWRVQYYGYAALGTDQYPPFTLADVPEYPARLEVDYPERLSRGLVLVKWWLLAIPQYIVVGLFVGGGLWLHDRGDRFDWAAGGLVGILVFVAAVVLLFTGRYLTPIFDFVLGMDRWVVRVGAYAALMTDEYPPFRLDTGGRDPAGPVVPAGVHHPPRPAQWWTPGRIASVIAGAVLALTAMGLISGGAAVLWADRFARDADGYLSTSNIYATSGYAIVAEGIDTTSWQGFSGVAGDVRARVSPTGSNPDVYVGIAPSDAVARYLAGADYLTVRDMAGNDVTIHKGQSVPAPPTSADIWATQTQGVGTQVVTWPAPSGDWTAVAMNPDGSPGVSVRAEIGATVPGLGWIGGTILCVGVLFLGAGVVLIAVPVHRAARQTTMTEV